MATRVKNGDVVMVVTGADKGKTGGVLRVLGGRERVSVNAINRVWKHVKPSQRHPQGGRIQKDASIHLSNVMPIDPSTGKGSRVKFETRDGAKHRLTKGGTSLGKIGK